MGCHMWEWSAEAACASMSASLQECAARTRMEIDSRSMQCSTTLDFKVCICDWLGRLGSARIYSLSCILLPQTIRRCSRRGWPCMERCCAPNRRLMARMEWQLGLNDDGFFELLRF